MNSIVFVFMIPIAYLDGEEAVKEPKLFIKKMKPSYKIFDLPKNVIHLNGNEFDNRDKNLIEVIITKEEVEYFG